MIGVICHIVNVMIRSRLRSNVYIISNVQVDRAWVSCAYSNASVHDTYQWNFTLVLDDGKRRKQFQMMDRSVGVYIPSGIWRELSDFSSDAVCLVLASTRYCESDYIRDYSEFLEVQNG